MRPTKKRSWDTALGGSKPSPEFQANTATAVAFCDNLNLEAPDLIPFPHGHTPPLSDSGHDIRQAKDGKRPLIAAPSQTARSLPEVNQSLQVDIECLQETPVSSASDLNLLSTPLSPGFDNEENTADAGEATTVCYGQLFPASQRSSATTQPDTLYSIRIRSDGITLCDAEAQEVAELDQRHAEIIKHIKTQAPSLKCEISLCLDDETVGDSSKKRSRMVVSCEMNLYGLACHAEIVANCLGEADIFLQEPYVSSPSIPYYNPHVYSTVESLRTPFFLNQSSQKDTRFDQEINEILHQTNHEGLMSQFEQDQRIKSPLQSHQVAAVKFMLSREAMDGHSLPPTMWKWNGKHSGSSYTHNLTRERRDTLVNECVGGLLADEMGLGKSLTLLALIVHTLEDTQCFTNDSNAMGSHPLQRIGATLIVTPYSTLRNWQDEISKHLDAGALRCYIYHGQAKSRLHQELASAQVVLTTYETIALGRRSSSSHLGQFSWFRIVLDESHWIRNQSTKVFQTLHEFEAQSRWCMTGTPVQNGLNDLCALTRWLRFYPFDTTRRFRKFITDPLSQRNEAGLKNLRQMIKIFQIRRVKECINLTRMTPQVVCVSLSDEERRVYEATKSSIMKNLSEAAKTKHPKASTTVLRGIQELRRICCDGLSLRGLSEYHLGESRASNVACNQCGRIVEGVAHRPIFHGQCGHTFCHVCFSKSQSGTNIEEAGGISCLLCGAIEEESTLPGDSSIMRASDHLATASLSTELSMESFVSAKIVTVVSKLLELHQKSSGNDCKSLVFSYWKRPLVLLENQLHHRNIYCVRIDGDCSAEERAKALTAFRGNVRVKVMLLTFGTGSVGLTLTEATHVHLLEPHWNPMVEEQATARAHRIGQGKPVTVWRYLVENSIEENIVRKQQKKLYLATIAHSKDEGVKQNEEKLEDLLEECHLLQG